MQKRREYLSFFIATAKRYDAYCTKVFRTRLEIFIYGIQIAALTIERKSSFIAPESAASRTAGIKLPSIESSNKNPTLMLKYQNTT
jgi:hypothetical protein